MINESEIKEPIIYELQWEVRYSDLDPYGHVASPHYLDFVISSRFAFVKKEMNLSSGEILKQGIGFYLYKSDIEYRRPIIGPQTIFVRSQVAETKETHLIVSFEIRSLDKQVLHSKGELDFVVMDLKTMKPQQLPEFAMPLFFRK